jgi:hypothetical protein
MKFFLATPSRKKQHCCQKKTPADRERQAGVLAEN